MRLGKFVRAQNIKKSFPFPVLHSTFGAKRTATVIWKMNSTYNTASILSTIKAFKEHHDSLFTVADEFGASQTRAIKENHCDM